MQWIGVVPFVVLVFLFTLFLIVNEQRHDRPITQSEYYRDLFILQWVGFFLAVGFCATPETVLVTAICWILGCTVALPFAWLVGTRIAPGT